MEFETGEYKHLSITGPVSVSLDDSQIRGRWNVLIMGPTGAGKSTFIEALGWEGGKPISSSGLDSFTQTLSGYRVDNVTIRNNIIRLVDSPGFADTKISDCAIVSMLREWLEENEGTYFRRILYFIPITHVRLPRSQRQVLKTFQGLTGVTSSVNITIITTMWDSIYGEDAPKRAEGTFKQFQDEIWKEYIDGGARIVKFHNTQQSAISNLDEAMIGQGLLFFHIEDMVRDYLSFHSTPLGANLYLDLEDRIQNLQSARTTLLLDLEQAKLESDAPLQDLILEWIREGDEVLAGFQREIQRLGVPPGFSPPPQPQDQRRRSGFSRAINSMKFWGK